MIYVKDNVERIVTDKAEANKLLSQGYKPVSPVKEVVIETTDKPVEKRRRRR